MQIEWNVSVIDEVRVLNVCLPPTLSVILYFPSYFWLSVLRQCQFAFPFWIVFFYSYFVVVPPFVFTFDSQYHSQSFAGYYNQSHGGQGHYAQHQQVQQQQQQHSGNVMGIQQQMQQMNMQNNNGNGNGNGNGTGSGDLSVDTNLNGNGDQHAVNGNDANGQMGAGGKKKRRRRKKKNSPANADSQNAEEQNFGSNSYASNPFKPGLHDNKRWNRGSKYQG